jgi:phosphate transport system substrate-binding protein
MTLGRGLLLLALAVGFVGCGAGGDRVTLQGSGASFPAPIYNAWFQAYNQQDGSIRINYQATGSGAGVKAFIAEQVNFGASDAAMKDSEIAQVEKGAVLLPMTAGSVVLAYNLDGVDELKLPRDVYADIFLGKVNKWNDPRIVAANPGTSLPDEDITVVHRADSSGTTFVFTKHLSTISPAWKNGPGTGKSIEWPAGVGAAKNDGVAAQIKQNPGAIGYVEYGFASNANLPTALLQNKAGKFIMATPESASAALGAVKLPDNLIAWVSDPEGEASYPIVTYTWVLAYKKYEDPKIAEALKKVLHWCLDEGQKMSTDLGYIPLPSNVVAEVKKAVDTIS